MRTALPNTDGAMSPHSPDQSDDVLDLASTRLKIRHLQLVSVIAEEGMLGAAADELGVSQPVVSRSLQELETIVGVRLFERGAKGVRPTLAGERFLAHAQSILSQLQLASRDLHEAANGDIGRVVVGSSLAGVDPILPAAVDRFHREYPRVVVTVYEAPPGELLKALLDGVTDLVLGRSAPTHLSGQLSALPLYRERLVLTVSTRHELAAAKSVTADDLSQLHWIVPDSRTSARSDLELAFLSMGIEMPARRLECSSVLTATELVKQSGYIAPLPLSVAQRDSELTVLNAPLGDIGWTLSLIRRKHGAMAFVAQAFEQHIYGARDALVEVTRADDVGHQPAARPA